MVLVYSEDITPRIKYIFKLIFSQILKTEVAFTSNTIEFQQSVLPKINYSVEKFENEFYIKPHRLILSKALIAPGINSVWYKGEKYFCESSKDSDFPFDPFAASFYVVTRYEEYLAEKGDKFGRYRSQNSILTRYNMQHKPVVNIWAKLIAEKLKEKHPELLFPETQFQFFSTIDIDNAFAYKNKGFWRTGAAWIQALVKGKSSQFEKRRKILSGKEKDPYDTYDYLDSVFEGNEDKVKFFFLLGDYGHYDKNIAHSNTNYRKLIQRIHKKYDVGLHTSFASSKKGGKKKVKQDKLRLERIIGEKVNKSRQHFLMLKFPKTYKRLLQAGITEDYTLGYSGQSGFRSGICTPHYFYDLKNDTATKLLIVPFQIMDGTLRHYLQLEPDKAFQEIERIMQEVRNVKGTFVSIWHNETVNNLGHWKGYREVFEKMNTLGFRWANEANEL